MTVATFTIRVEDELKNAFTAAAKAKDRTAGQLIRDFMRDYVLKTSDDEAYDRWFRKQVEAGLADVRAGRTVPSEEVEAHFARVRAELRRKIQDSEA